MKRLLGAIASLIFLAGAGYAAYRLGLVERFSAPSPTGTSASSVAAPGAPPPADAAGGTQPPGSAHAAGTESPASGAAVPPAGGGTPIAAGLVAVARPGEAVSNKAIELRVTGQRTAPSIGGQSAGAGREFVIVDTAWKSLVPPQKVNRKKAQDRTAGMGGLGFGGGATAQDKAGDEANTTIEDVPFAIGPMTNHVWLITDGRDTEAIAVAATQAVDGHVSTGTLTIPGFEKVVAGGIAFEAPANAQALSLLVLDSKNGHLLIPIKGAAPALVSSLGGAGRSNELVELAMAGTSWAESPAQGSKTLVVTLRGISRKEAIADIPFGDFGFLQTDLGCVAQPDANAPSAVRPLAPVGRFLPFVPREGQLAFTVPADTRAAVLMLRASGAGPIELTALGDGTMRKPPFMATHDDGTVLRVHVVGTSTPPAGLPPAPEGVEHLVVDYVVESLKTGAGLELQPAQQFALADDQGAKYAPERASQQLPCRLAGANVVPAGVRRCPAVF